MSQTFLWQTRVDDTISETSALLFVKADPEPQGVVLCRVKHVGGEPLYPPHLRIVFLSPHGAALRPCSCPLCVRRILSCQKSKIQKFKNYGSVCAMCSHANQVFRGAMQSSNSFNEPLFCAL